MFSYHPATNHMFSGLNPPDGEVQTIRGFSAQIPIFGCVKNFMHLISFYLSLIISNYTSAKRMSYLCDRNRKDKNHSSLAPPNNAPFFLQIGQNALTLRLGRRGVGRKRGRRRGLPLTPNGERMSEERMSEVYPPPPLYKGDCFSLMNEGE